MTTGVRPLWQTILRRRPRGMRIMAEPAEPRLPAGVPQIDIAPNDPLLAYLQGASGPVDIAGLDLDSPALRAMREANIQLVVPLVSQGDLIGLLNLGPRLSQQEYSADDRVLLGNLAAQATPAVRVAQLVREQQAEAEERQRIEQELQVARLIQHTLLPKSVPQLDGWSLAAYYRPARAVGGDFYDFIALGDDKLGLVVGDVTDKGVPAALVMATTRSWMRAAATRLDDPGVVLERVNSLLCPDIPPNMFVTCLYAILDARTGVLRYANAGHDLPYQRTGEEVRELRARGMPLGLMDGMSYEVQETVLEPGDTVLFYSDGLVEAHAPDRDMFGFPRLRQEMAVFSRTGEESLVDFLLQGLADFTGQSWEQEDDITLVTLHRSTTVAHLTSFAGSMLAAEEDVSDIEILETFEVPSCQGNERIAMRQVRALLEPLDLPVRVLDNLDTAVSEATMNAMEHGNQYQEDAPVRIQVALSPEDVIIRIIDRGEAEAGFQAQVPDLEEKLAGLQTPRGWGLFLIERMVDQMRVTDGREGHTVELIVSRKGAEHGS